MEHKRLVGKVGAADQIEEMNVESVESVDGIPKLKPRVVPKGKFSHRQGKLISGGGLME
jgi:hypothetical protein